MIPADYTVKRGDIAFLVKHLVVLYCATWSTYYSLLFKSVDLSPSYNSKRAFQSKSAIQAYLPPVHRAFCIIIGQAPVERVGARTRMALSRSRAWAKASVPEAEMFFPRGVESVCLYIRFHNRRAAPAFPTATIMAWGVEKWVLRVGTYSALGGYISDTYHTYHSKDIFSGFFDGEMMLC